MGKKIFRTNPTINNRTKQLSITLPKKKIKSLLKDGIPRNKNWKITIEDI